MNTVILTGSSGFLGKAILKYFSDLKINVLTIGRLPSNNIYCDLTLGSPKIHLNNIDLVIHSAGKAHFTPISEEDAMVFHSVNVLGTINLLKGFTGKKIPKYFIYISSVSVYGLTKGNLIDETTPLLATDPYGKSKIESEEIIIKWCKDNNVVCTILRVPLIVGTNPPGNLKAMITAIQKGYYFNISGGKAKKSMVLAQDIAEILLKAAEVGGVYNLTDGYHPDFSELSHLISRQIGKSYVLNIPFWLASFLAYFGDKICFNFPFNSNKLKKISATLTFDDFKARKAFDWNPSNVLEKFRIDE